MMSMFFVCVKIENVFATRLADGSDQKELGSVGLIKIQTFNVTSCTIVTVKWAKEKITRNDR